MSERRSDDTTEREELPQTEQEIPDKEKSGSYYYDDSTGYEIYNPEEDGEDEESQQHLGGGERQMPDAGCQ